MKRRRNYTPLGRFMFDLALEKADAEGPYNIANYMTTALGRKVAGPSVSEYFRGTYGPPSHFMSDFAEAFELTEEERGRLAWAYAYGFPLAA